MSALQNRSYEKVVCSLLLLLQFVFFVIRMFDGQAPNIEIITDSRDDIDLDISFQSAVFWAKEEEEKASRELLTMKLP